MHASRVEWKKFMIHGTCYKTDRLLPSIVPFSRVSADEFFQMKSWTFIGNVKCVFVQSRIMMSEWWMLLLDQSRLFARNFQELSTKFRNKEHRQGERKKHIVERVSWGFFRECFQQFIAVHSIETNTAAALLTCHQLQVFSNFLFIRASPIWCVHFQSLDVYLGSSESFLHRKSAKWTRSCLRIKFLGTSKWPTNRKKWVSSL